MPVMSNKKSKIQTRVLIAGSLLVASILSSVLISVVSNQKQSFWIANRELTPGQQIAASDISKAQVNISPISNNYIATDINPVGSIVINRIQSSSLIATQSISSQSDSINSAEISSSCSDIENNEKVTEIEINEIDDQIETKTANSEIKEKTTEVYSASDKKISLSDLTESFPNQIDLINPLTHT
jgi:hypothetical protein